MSVLPVVLRARRVDDRRRTPAARCCSTRACRSCTGPTTGSTSSARSRSPSQASRCSSSRPPPARSTPTSRPARSSSRSTRDRHRRPPSRSRSSRRASRTISAASTSPSSANASTPASSWPSDPGVVRLARVGPVRPRPASSSSSSRTGGSGRVVAGPCRSGIDGAVRRDHHAATPAFEAQFDRCSATRSSVARRPGERHRSEGRQGTMLRCPQYSFIAGVLSVALALGCYVLAFVSARARVAAAAARPSPGRAAGGGTATVDDDPQHRRRGPRARLRHAFVLAGARLPHRVARLPHYRDRPRPVRQHVRVLHRVRAGARSRCTSTSSVATTCGPSASRPADRPGAAALRDDRSRRPPTRSSRRCRTTCC